MARTRKRKPSKKPSDDVKIAAWTKRPADRYLDDNWQFLIGNPNRQLIFYHVVWHGVRRGIFSNWDGDDGAKPLVNGFPGNKHGHADTFDDAVELLREGLRAEMTVGDLVVPVSSSSQTTSANVIPATEESTDDEMSSIASSSQTPSETSTPSSVADEEMLDDEEGSNLLSPEDLSSPQHTPNVAGNTRKTMGEDQPEEPRLCKEQQDALNLALEGRNLFITGSGGCGKSVLVKALFQKLRANKKRVHLLAPTGQAAVNIEGATIQHFMGWSAERNALDYLVLKAQKNEQVYKHVTRTDVLIIDEISMVDNHLFTRLGQTMSRVRHEAAQEEGSKLDNADDVKTLLENRGVEDGIRLFSKKDDVSTCNDEESWKLSSRAEVYKRLDHLEKEQHNMDAEESLPEARHAKTITLKVGMPVMLLENIDVESGLCNGSQGVIRDFASRLHEEPKEPKSRNYKGDTDAFELALRRYRQTQRCGKAKKDMMYPEVEFSHGVRRIIGPDCTISRLGTKPYSYWSQVQIPLTPCWAMTIHKSQGMSLDRVVANITNIWDCGQAYVALSRARSLEGLELKGNNLRRTMKSKFRADQEVRKFMDMLEAQAKKESQ